MKIPLKERFYKHVQITDGCWIWTADINIGGYGRIIVNRDVKAAHRVSYEMSIGPRHIFKTNKISKEQLANEFNVCSSTIRNVIHGKTWRHI